MGNYWTVTHINTWENTRREYVVNIPMPHINSIHLARKWLARELQAQGYRGLWTKGECTIDDGEDGDNTWYIERCDSPPPAPVAPQQSYEDVYVVLAVVFILPVISLAILALSMQ